MNARIDVRITCNTGNYWFTGINTDLEGARRYFMGQTFVHESYDGTETPETVVNVTEVKS